MFPFTNYRTIKISFLRTQFSYFSLSLICINIYISERSAWVNLILNKCKRQMMYSKNVFFLPSSLSERCSIAASSCSTTCSFLSGILKECGWQVSDWRVKFEHLSQPTYSDSISRCCCWMGESRAFKRSRIVIDYFHLSFGLLNLWNFVNPEED